MDNTSLFFYIFGLSGRSNIADGLMIFGARFIIYLAFLLMLLQAFFKGSVKEKKAVLLTVLALPVVVLLIKGIHLFFFEPRPFVNYQITPLLNIAEDASFPSRHAGVMSAIAFSYFHFKSGWAPLLILLMLWVGISRIYVGVHYPLDILGGFGVGIFALFITKQILNRLKVRFFSQSF